MVLQRLALLYFILPVVLEFSCEMYQILIRHQWLTNSTARDPVKITKLTTWTPGHFLCPSILDRPCFPIILVLNVLTKRLMPALANFFSPAHYDARVCMSRRENQFKKTSSMPESYLSLSAPDTCSGSCSEADSSRSFKKNELMENSDVYRCSYACLRRITSESDTELFSRRTLADEVVPQQNTDILVPEDLQLHSSSSGCHGFISRSYFAEQGTHAVHNENIRTNNVNFKLTNAAINKENPVTFELRFSSLAILCLIFLFLGNGELKQKLKLFAYNLPMANSMGNLVDSSWKYILEGDLISEHKTLFKRLSPQIESRPSLVNHRQFSETQCTTRDSFRSYEFGPVDLGKGNPECKQKSRRLSTHMNTFIPTTVYTTFPASFLPAAGSSPSDNMLHVGCRLASLNILPASCDISRVRLAQTGFYYDSNKTSRDASNIHEVVCYCCGITYGQWKTGDNPVTVHVNLSPHCDHLKATVPETVRPASKSSSVFSKEKHFLPSSKESSEVTSYSKSSLGTFSPISSKESSEVTSYSKSSLGTFSPISSKESSEVTSYSKISIGTFSTPISPKESNEATSYSKSSLGTFSTPISSKTLSSELQTVESTPDSEKKSEEVNSQILVYTALQSYDGKELQKKDGLGDLETDCAAIVPTPLTSPSRKTPTWTQTAVSTSVSSAVQQQSPSNQNWQFASRDKESARVHDLQDRPPLEMSEAVYPQFCRLQDRRATFTAWPLSSVFPPDQLIMLGFYYAGYADCIRCFYCGVGLKSWSEHDDVMTEHIRWRPTCGYVLNTKGRQFVQRVLDSLQTNNREIQTADSTFTPSSFGSATARDSASSTTLTAGGNIGATVVLKTLEEMGFSQELVASAFSQFQTSGTSETTVDGLEEKILAMDANEATGINMTNTGSTTSQPGTENQLRQGADSERVQRILSENKRLKARQVCKSCKESQVGMIFLPCGHIVACTQCGSKLRNCSACGRHIQATANVVVS